MDLLTGGLIPTLVILISNVFSDRSRNYEYITALFYWVAITGFILYFFLMFVSLFFQYPWLQYCKQLWLSVGSFSLFAALSRDYEKRLKQIIFTWRRKNK